MYDHVIWPLLFDPKTSAIYALNDIDVNAQPEVVWKLLVDADLIDHTHTATAQLLNDAVMRNRSPGEWRRIRHRREFYSAPRGKSTRVVQSQWVLFDLLRSDYH